MLNTKKQKYKYHQMALFSRLTDDDDDDESSQEAVTWERNDFQELPRCQIKLSHRLKSSPIVLRMP